MTLLLGIAYQELNISCSLCSLDMTGQAHNVELFMLAAFFSSPWPKIFVQLLWVFYEPLPQSLPLVSRGFRGSIM